MHLVLHETIAEPEPEAGPQTVAVVVDEVDEVDEVDSLAATTVIVPVLVPEK